MFTGGDRAARFHEWVVALHEAAHAAVATALGIRIEEVSVIPGPGTRGHCRYHAQDRGPNQPRLTHWAAPQGVSLLGRHRDSIGPQTPHPKPH